MNGQKTHNKHAKVRAAYDKKRDYNKGKTIVFGMLERGGELITEVIERADAKSIHPIIAEKVAPDSIFVSDGAKAYLGIHKYNIKHYSVDHAQNEYVRGILHTNSLEGFWSQVKRTVIGTHIHVSRKHLQKYLNECAFRYTMRDKQDQMFDTILSRV